MNDESLVGETAEGVLGSTVDGSTVGQDYWPREIRARYIELAPCFEDNSCDLPPDGEAPGSAAHWPGVRRTTDAQNIALGPATGQPMRSPRLWSSLRAGVHRSNNAPRRVLREVARNYMLSICCD